MPFATLPIAIEIQTLLRSAGYWPTDATKQELARYETIAAVEAAIDEFNNLSGWNPYQAADTATARTFDSTDHTGFLDFEGAAISVESVAINGTAQALGSQYRPYPQNAVSRGQSITGLQMGRYGDYGGYYNPGSIVVMARWGRVENIPADVWAAIRQKAALMVLTQTENLQSVASISEDGFSKAYDVVGIVTQKDLAAGGLGGGGIWGREFATIAARHKRVVC